MRMEYDAVEFDLTTPKPSKAPRKLYDYRKTMFVTKTSKPLKWHGGKHYLADRIIRLMPAHTHYVEPYAGGL